MRLPLSHKQLIFSNALQAEIQILSLDNYAALCNVE